MPYYAFTYKNKEGKQDWSIYHDWSKCQNAMGGKTHISVKKCNTYDEAKLFLESKNIVFPSQVSGSSSHGINLKPFRPSSCLTEEQLEILKFIMEGDQNGFITGPAGTGKSFLIHEITRYLRHSGMNHGTTGSTGASAVLIHGKTLHSFMGIGIGNKPATIYAKFMKSPLRRRLQSLHTLLIDEISMISDLLLDKINELLKLVRHSERPFGGVRMIFIGDACQLPPVEGTYFFKSEAWKESNARMFYLTRLIRQDKDEIFQQMLSRLRWGYCCEEDYQLLKACKKKEWPKNMNVKPTRLYAINVDVDSVNEKAFAELMEEQSNIYPDGIPLQSYSVKYLGAKTSAEIDILKRWATSCRIPESITLCKGAQVMVTWNIQVDAGIVNGTRGVVREIFEDHVDIETVKGEILNIPYVSLSLDDMYESDKTIDPQVIMGIEYIPLKLAYALTIHKTQGVTLDCAEIYVGNTIFEYGQAYTALSRVKNLENIKIIGLVKKAFKTHPDVLEFYKDYISVEV